MQLAPFATLTPFHRKPKKMTDTSYSKSHGNTYEFYADVDGASVVFATITGKLRARAVLAWIDSNYKGLKFSVLDDFFAARICAFEFKKGLDRRGRPLN